MMTPITADRSDVQTATEHLLGIPHDGETAHGIEVPLERAQTYRNAASVLKKRNDMKFRTKTVRARGVLQVWRLA